MISKSPRLDHIILLLPYDLLLHPPCWLTENFTITPGGQHADGKTENKLICFQDGSYLELIAFINDDPRNREGHWWGKKGFGIIDFAFTHTSLDATTFYTELQENFEALKPLNVGYDRPALGGRTRPDNVDVKWVVTFPDNNFQRGEIPFFCHELRIPNLFSVLVLYSPKTNDFYIRTSNIIVSSDVYPICPRNRLHKENANPLSSSVTPRSLRVSYTKEYVTHPSGAYGIKQLGIFVPGTRLNTLKHAYAALFNEPNAGDNVSLESGVFDVGRACHLEGVGPVRIKIQEPIEDWQVSGLKQEGGSVFIGELVLASHATDIIVKVNTDLEASGAARVSVENGELVEASKV